ncbi:Diphthamide biosynthesis protein 2 [Teratosphaeria destructans]|uniref:2-(3-amino-3-carboxypropyl)histidine synthase subunit 2 n=1 Tax=Teratosphaeria destructans TaxID=418781 RepID=A0A9W7SVX7_9PEZI|nr:Diphthamide biosynthesis protein 2 [Teratosphaeria destructans]
MATSAPILSTPSEGMIQVSAAVPRQESQLSDEQLYLQYEIRRTVDEIREGRWRRIALQFPDDMLVDAPRVYERLRDGLRAARNEDRSTPDTAINGIVNGVGKVRLETEVTRDPEEGAVHDREVTTHGQHPLREAEGAEKGKGKLCILGDTSYGACCVDEVAAEHVEAEVVVHYGRACLSPTARLPVIYVFTSKALHLESTIASFINTYPDKDDKVCLMADIPYSHHIPELAQRLCDQGYTNVFATDIVRDPSSLIPNRTIPPDAQQDADKLGEYAIFHISDPPTSLLLILSSRVKSVHIHPTDTTTPTASEATSTALLRRRYALITRLATVPIVGILINTLSVSNYMAALQHCQDLISQAGKKSYVFVVGKVNAAKIANFSEIGGWVVIGCWESSLIESKEFYRPIITPFELEVALTDDRERVWGSEWVGDFGALLGRERKVVSTLPTDADLANAEADQNAMPNGNDDWTNQSSDDEPPEFDLRTGRYVSHSRPMGRPRPSKKPTSSPTDTSSQQSPTTSSALIQRSTNGSLTTINGTVSPAAEYLKTKRTWQGLGSDYEVAYERDEHGRIRGAGMEEGRGGVAKGYAVGGGRERS